MKKTIGYVVLFLLLVGAGFFIYKAFVPSANFEIFYRMLRVGRAGEINLYFTQNEIIVPVVRKVPRIWSADEKVKNAIALLLQGPDEAEKAAGYDSALPREAQLLSVSIEEDTVSVNFSKQIDEGGGTGMMLARLRQIVYTATQFSGVNKVRFLIDGQPIKYFSSEGLTEVEYPIGRADLEMEEK
ncbi:MAG: GerMN domain-containing protein [Candidatus Omnitrophica bacterium]|nr:GerMN domain-containing protein [Candidatus Omnitrophota bacterium]